MTNHPLDDAWWTATALGIAGAIVGSFLATITVRWPAGRSIVHGRSTCDGCGRALRPWHLIPLASWLAARGRCDACGVRIDPRHPLVELGCATIGVVSACCALPGEAIAGSVFGWLLLTLAVIDATDFWLPNPLVATLAVAGGISAIWFHPAVPDRLAGGMAGFLSLWAISAAYRHVRGRDGMGGGDPKLFGAIGLWLGWQLLPAVLVIAGLTGLGWVLWRRLHGHLVAADDMVPLGTLLAIAAYPAWLAMIVWRP